MKFFAVFATLLAVACAQQQWTLNELSVAIQDPSTPAEMMPYLEEALNTLMTNLMTGQQQDTIAVSTPVIITPAQDLTSWSLYELSEALQDPTTPTELVPYLEDALNTMMANLVNGEQQDTIIVATPVGLLPVVASPVAVPSPVVLPAPVAPEVVFEVPEVVPEVVSEVTSAASSPLVQIIVNIKQQAAVSAPVVDVADVPAPVDAIVDWVAPVRPEPEHSVVPEGPFVPVNPVDVIAVAAPEVISVVTPEVNPVDVIAVAAPEVNPVDIFSPVPVVAGTATVDGPIL